MPDQQEAAYFAASTTQCGVKGHLADLTSQAEADALGTFVMANLLPSTIAWIGLNDQDSEGNFKWSDGSNLGFSNWGIAEPNGGLSENCAIISPVAGKWSDYGCRQGGAGVLVEYDCPPSATAMHQGRRYEYFSSGPATGTWYQAELAASQMYQCGVQGHLATLTTQDENNAVWTAIAPAVKLMPWIGLNDIAKENNFKWVTGEAFQYSDWQAGEPNNVLGKEHCVEFFDARGNWNDVTCPSIRGSLVEFDCPTPEPSSVPSEAPVAAPSSLPSEAPVAAPSSLPSEAPTMPPTFNPSAKPSVAPSIKPSAKPSANPSRLPSANPSRSPSTNPSRSPSTKPSLRPSTAPSNTPSAAPTTYAYTIKMCYRNTMLNSNCGCSNTDGFACFKQVSREVCQEGVDKSLLINTKEEYEAFFDETDKAYLSQCNVP